MVRVFDSLEKLKVVELNCNGSRLQDNQITEHLLIAKLTQVKKVNRICDKCCCPERNQIFAQLGDYPDQI